MKGYFRGLAKQTGLAFAGGNRTVRVAPSAAPDSISASPLHIENIDLVESSTLVGEGGLQHRANRQAVEASAFRGEREQPERAMDVETSATRPSDLTRSSTDNTPHSVSSTEVFETRFDAERSVPSTMPSRSSDLGSDTEGFEQSGSKPGVVRVGEGQDYVESRHKHELSNFAEAIRREEQTIPREYLEGIREWLSSSVTRTEELENRIIAEHDSGPSTPSFPSLVERDHQTQNQVQEFSLSIGSISVVVEEPAQPARPKQNNTQEAGHQSVNVQSRTSDAFALTRSYFRGF